jgi:hypothetical protein
MFGSCGTVRTTTIVTVHFCNDSFTMPNRILNGAVSDTTDVDSSNFAHSKSSILFKELIHSDTYITILFALPIFGHKIKGAALSKAK